MVTVEFFYDFGSLNAYLAHLVVPGIEHRTGARFEYVPILLGGVFKLTNNRSPMEAFRGVKGKLENEMREIERFRRKHHIDRYTFNPHFPINTLQIMRGAIVAQQGPDYPRYVNAMFDAVWGDPKKMDDPAVIVAALDAAGLNGRQILERTQDPAVKEQLLRNTQAAVDRGMFGAPTFFVGSEMFFGKDRLRDVEEEIERVQAPG